MNSPDFSDGQWKVTVQAGGEILAAAAIEPSIELGLLGVPAGYSAPEIQGWLHDLIGVARETGRDDAKPRPIPALLHHGLTGLLFSHAQLWNREGQRHPMSYAVVHAPGAFAFGWIGEASITTQVDGRAVEVREVIVRDDEGREAHALELPDTATVDIRLEWAPDPGTRVVLDAHWPGPGADAVAEEPSFSAAAFEPPADSVPDEPPGSAIAQGPPAWVEPAGEGFAGEAQAPAAAGPVAHATAPPEDLVRPLEPHLTPDTPVVRMEGIEREPIHPFAETDASFLDPGSEPIDLDAAGAREPGGSSTVPHGPAHANAPRDAALADGPHELRPSATEAVASAASDHGPVPAPHVPLEAQAVRAQAMEEPRGAAPAAEAETAAEAPAPVEQAAATPAVETMTEPDDADEDDFFSGTHEVRPSRLRRMFDRFAFWRRPGAQDSPESEATLDPAGEEALFDVPGVPDQVPPSPEPAHLTAQAAADPGTHSQLENAGEEELVGAAAAPDAPAAARGDDAIEASGVSPATEAAAARVETVPAASPAPPPHGPALEPHVVEPREVEPAAVEPAAVEPGSQASVAPAPARTARTPMRPQWPTAEELREPAPLWKRPWVWGMLMAALFAGGWIIGHMNDERRAGAARGVRNVLRSVGLGGAHFEVMVNSRPQGAWISVDGEDLARRTPASIELEPGEHEVTLSFSDLGSATFQVRGADGDRLALEPPLWGAVQIYSSDQEVPVAVSVDGVPRGFAPLRVDSLSPGAHEVRFSGPGLPSWGQTVQVRVDESAELVARPMSSPATGLIEIRASLPTENGTSDIEGAQVWLDGEPAGRTPLTLELPRGPHSIRVEHLGETAPVQVIDLPGGNQRFASFLLRSGDSFPTLAAIDAPAEVPLDQPTVVSVALDGVQTSSVREMWMHVQTPDGPWRRYQMAWLKATGGVVGVAVFPTTLFGADGRVRWYASASTHAGDEYFSEVQTAVGPGAAPESRPRGR